MKHSVNEMEQACEMLKEQVQVPQRMKYFNKDLFIILF